MGGFPGDPAVGAAGRLLSGLYPLFHPLIKYGVAQLKLGRSEKWGIDWVKPINTPFFGLLILNYVSTRRTLPAPATGTCDTRTDIQNRTD